MTWKHHDELTVEEARDELESLNAYFEICAEEGHGIGSSESVRQRACAEIVLLNDELGVTPESYKDIGVLEYVRRAHLMFADPDCNCATCYWDREKRKILEES